KPKKYNLINAKKPQKKARRKIDGVARENETKTQKQITLKSKLAKTRKTPKDTSPKVHHALKPRKLPKDIQLNPKTRAMKIPKSIQQISKNRVRKIAIAPKQSKNSKRERLTETVRSSKKSRRKEIFAHKKKNKMPSYYLERMLHQWKRRGRKLSSRKKSVR